MEQFTSFFGEVVGRNDLDFLNTGNRQAIVQTHNTLTINNGGIVNGLNVSFSQDKLSLVVSPGVFYTSGAYSDQNNQGGGERGELLQQIYTTGLPQTPPLGTTPQYLLVYAKIVTSNTDPNPLLSSQIVTSRNLQTGENVPTREYAQAVIVVTNPGVKNSLLAVQGVPLALIQVNFVGANRVSSDGSIQVIDTSIRRNYAIANTVDVNAGELLDAGVPNDFLTTRMYQDNSISGPKFLNSSIGTTKLALWDGTTAYNNLSGSGVANQNIKANAITEDKINYQFGLNGFGNRNELLNSSFENSLTDWTVAAYLPTAVSVVSFSSDPTAPKYGNNGLFLQGGVDGSNNALHLSVSQIIDFGENLFNQPVSAFYWARQTSVTDFTKNGTTGLSGLVEFIDNSTNPVTLYSVPFGLISGVTSTGYLQYSTTSPVIYSGSQTCSKVRITIGGNFNGDYYVDGVFMGLTSLIPLFDVNPSEYIVPTVNFSQVLGQVQNAQIASASVDISKIQNAAVGTSQLVNGAVTGQKIAVSGISTANIQNGAITAAKIDPTIILGVPSGFLIFTDQPGTNCPPGWTDVTAGSTWSGFIPVGVNPASTNTALSTVGGITGPAMIDPTAVTTMSVGHTHDSHDQGTNASSATGPGIGVPQSTTLDAGEHTHSAPIIAVRICRAP